MEFPTHPGEITADWLTTVLKEAGLLEHNKVRSVTALMLGTDKGMAGQLVRLFLDYSTSNPDAPHSLIAKFSASNAQMRGPLHAMGFYEREVRFYNQLAPISLLRTPYCYFGAFEPEGGSSLLLLEDLSFAENGNAVEGCSIADAEMAVRAIAPFHAQWWQEPSLEGHNWLQLKGFLSVANVQASFDRTWGSFLSIISDPLAEEIVPLSDDLHRYLGRISTDLYMEGQRTLIHNDYHVENLFFVETARSRSVVAADWQGPTMGRGVIDIARLLGGNLDPNDRRDNELRLLRAYHTILMENGVSGYSFEQCWDDYRTAMLLPLGMISMVMGMAARMMPNPESIKGGPREVIVSRYCKAVADLGVSDLLKSSYVQEAATL